MAKARDNRPNPLGWMLLGFVVGVAATVALYLYLTRPHDPPPPLDGAAPSMKMLPPPLPADPAPAVKPAPAITTPAPAAPPTPDTQIEDDAAASGLTGRAPSADQAADPAAR